MISVLLKLSTTTTGAQEAALSYNTSNRKSVPSAIARELRQEAGFGCCKCGIPIIQYHHIVEWAQEEHHRAEDMMVLCPNHHDQATKGAMSKPEQRALKASPFNRKTGRASGMLAVKQSYCAADIGTVTVVGEGVFLSIDQSPMLSFDLDGNQLLISLKLYDEKDNLLVEICRNEWITGDPLPWDIEADWQRLMLRERARKISLNINAKRIPMEITGEFWLGGKKIVCDRDGISLHRTEGNGAARFSQLAFVGMQINIDSTNFSFGPLPNSSACIISWPNPRERLWKAKDAWIKIQVQRQNRNLESPLRSVQSETPS